MMTVADADLTSRRHLDYPASVDGGIDTGLASRMTLRQKPHRDTLRLFCCPDHFQWWPWRGAVRLAGSAPRGRRYANPSGLPPRLASRRQLSKLTLRRPIMAANSSRSGPVDRINSELFSDTSRRLSRLLATLPTNDAVNLEADSTQAYSRLLERLRMESAQTVSHSKLAMQRALCRAMSA